MICAATIGRFKPNWPLYKKQLSKMNTDPITFGGLILVLSELDDLPLSFDEKLWQGTVGHVTVYAD